MKKIFLLAILISTYMLSKSQTRNADSWKIKWNKKTILETGKENATLNNRKIKKTDLDKICFLEIIYTEADTKKEKDWNRSFMLYDENDNELLRKDSTRNTKIAAAVLKKLFGNKKKISIYTTMIPADPELAARVRLRRVQLCTLDLK